jgi:hypothetical protein
MGGVKGKRNGASTRPRMAKSPPALSGEDLSRLNGVLDSQRSLGSDSYPVPLTRLFELARIPATDEALKIFTSAKNAKLFALTDKSSKAKPDATRQALVYFPQDAERIARSAALFVTAIEAAKQADKVSDIFTSTDLKKWVPKAQQKAFLASVDGWARSGKAPFPGVIVLRKKVGAKTNLYLHRLESALPATVSMPASSARDFAREFAREFDRLDRASGNNNYVLLHDLRRAMPDMDRAEFDSRLRELRVAKLFTLDSPDGRHVRLTPEQLDAGIREGSSNLVYVARR